MTGVWTTRLLVALALLAGLVVDAVLPAPGLPDPVEQPEALRAGAAACAALSTGGEGAVDALTLTGPVPEPLDGEDVSAELSTSADGEVVARAAVGAGVVSTAVVDDLSAPLLSLRWRTAPVVLGRTWQVPAGDDRPGGRVQGSCPEQADDRWFVPGVATAGGAAAQLHLANPFEGTATARVSFTTPAGRLEPTRLQNVVVPARSSVSLDLGEFAPEEPDLGVVVELDAGRVVVEAVQSLSPAIGGVAGASLVPATRGPAEVWTVPHLRVAEDTTSWLWVTNPGDVPADVRLSLQTADGPLVPPEGGLVVGPGTTERLDLGAVLPPGEPVGVTLRSTSDAPVVVSGVTVTGADDPARSGVAVVEALAGEGSDAVQVQVGSDVDEEREAQLHVTNLTTEPATYDVRVVTAAGEQAPPELQGLTLAPGTRAGHDLTAQVAGPVHAVLLEPSQGRVAGVLLSRNGSGPLELVLSTLRPLPGVGDATPLRGSLDTGLLPRVGTGYGVQPPEAPSAEPFGATDEAPQELPDDPVDGGVGTDDDPDPDTDPDTDPDPGGGDG